MLDFLFGAMNIATILAMVPAAFLCLLWAPIGGLITGLLARSHGLPAVKCGAAAVLYSAALFWPWLYFTADVNRKHVDEYVRIVYVGLFAAWLATTAGVSALTLLEWFGDLAAQDVQFAWEFGPLLDLVKTFAWCGSLIWLCWPRRELGMRDASEVPLIPLRYIQPFILCAISTLSFPFATHVIDASTNYRMVVYDY